MVYLLYQYLFRHLCRIYEVILLELSNYARIGKAPLLKQLESRKTIKNSLQSVRS